MRGILGASLLAACMAAHAQQEQKPGWPAVGDRWEYEARDADRPARTYRAIVEVQEVTSDSISDVFRTREGAHVTQTHEAGAFLRAIAPGIANFSPYLRAFQELRGGERWASVDYRQLWECGVGLLDCVAEAQVAGREKVTVPAGTFDAWKIVVRLRMGMAGSASGGGELRYWLADEAKRIVKHESRINFIIGGHYQWPQPNMDFELLSYTPARK
jgi:hypothetical protein